LLLIVITRLQMTVIVTEAAGVVCAQDTLDIHDDCREDDKLCLVGGTSGSGNVYHAGHPVCHNGWDFSDANVVCREQIARISA